MCVICYGVTAGATAIGGLFGSPVTDQPVAHVSPPAAVSFQVPSPEAGNSKVAKTTPNDVLKRVNMNAEMKPPLFPITRGTVFSMPYLITPQSPSDFLAVTERGTASRFVYDRRRGWVTSEFFLFAADFTATKQIEVIVNKEFETTEAARKVASDYAFVIGQLPRACRTNVDAIWIHAGNEDAGGGNRSILVHTDRLKFQDQHMEEIMVHECAHTSLDWQWQGVVDQDKWIQASTLDGAYISEYAARFPLREDVAETFLLYVYTKLRASEPNSANLLARIRDQIPNRLAYFDSLNLDLSPLASYQAPPPPAPAAVSQPVPKATKIIGSKCSKVGVKKIASNATLVCRVVGKKLKWQS
jgi:hypothetical protein